jgi:large subunit ribosomal protein L25
MAYPKNMPEFIEVDISGLELGKSIKVEDLLNEEFDILNSPVVSVVSVNIPRVKIEIEEEEEEGEEGAEGAEGAEGVTEGGEKKEGGSEGASEGGDKKEEKKDS